MKRILITGSNSYVGTSFTKYINEHCPNDYDIEEISVQGDEWKSYDFSKYDVIFHVAGIAHIRETANNEHLYYKVNRDLAYEVAKKSKEEKIKQFIFMSSMSVYGINQGEINKNTTTNPKSTYGKSKLEAEIKIKSLESNKFKVAILRPPMIYGPGAKGNYPKLSKLAKITPIFPNYQNKRSMIFIDNLSINIKNIIDNSLHGIFTPQNNEYINTSELVKIISLIDNKNIYLTKLFNPLIPLTMNISIVNKVFGSLIYTDFNNNLEIINYKKTIELTERGK